MSEHQTTQSLMPTWKLNIFVRVIKQRMETEQRTAEEIITGYPLLTEEEKAEILNNIGGELIGNI